MKNVQSTRRLVEDDGSTRPHGKIEHYTTESEQIRDIWRNHDWGRPSGPKVDTECLNRHKSLVLELAMQDFAQQGQDVKNSADLEAYCLRFRGLGEPLENAIALQLEVEQYANANPNVLKPWRSLDWLRPGATFLNFEVLEEMGRGRFGRVYLCRQLKLGGKLAVVKVESGKSFDEPKLLGKISHPNVMPITWADYDSAQGVSYLCMPFYGKSTLVDLIKLAFRDGVPQSASLIEEASRLWVAEPNSIYPISAAETQCKHAESTYVGRVLELASDLADGLAYVHEKQIVHGDIKPSNVLLAPSGKPYLLDFNLGRNRQEAAYKIGGTLAYMAPEQLEVLSGNSANPELYSNFKTDVFSFGTLLYELFAGNPPYDPPASQQEVQEMAREMRCYQSHDYLPLREQNPYVDREIAKLVDQCLATDPTDRPSTMVEVRDCLTEFSSQLKSFRRYVRQNPQRAWSASLGIAAAIAIVSMALILRPPLTERLYSQAEASRSENKLKESIDHATRILAIDPDYNAARFLRACNYTELKEYAAAHADLRRLSRTTKNAEFIAYYAYVNNLMGNSDAAVLWYKKALNHGFKRNSAILNNLGISLLFQTKPKDPGTRAKMAAPVLKEAFQLNPNSATLRLNLIRLVDSDPKHDGEMARKAAEEHVSWLTSNLPNHAAAWKAVYTLHLLMAQHGLVASSEPEAALRKSEEAPIKASLPLFLDPLSNPDDD